MKRVLLLGFITLLLSASSSYGQNPFGTWQGLYTPTEKFIGLNIPVGSPPFDPIPLEFILHPFDGTAAPYGVANFGNGTPGEFIFGGNFITLSQNGGSLTAVSFIPEEGEPTGYADLTATVSGDSMTGTFNGRSPAGIGWFHLRGTIELSRVVPEPSTGLLLAIGGGTLALLRRRGGAGGRT